ncbi:MAG: glycosyl hydrolase [bacterium]|nr:glycosyl hydrolase [bacterium]
MRLLGSICVVLLLLTSPAAARKEKQAEEDDRRMSAATFSGLELRGIGPALMSGRIADIAIHPTDQSTWYVAVGSGNLWKTTNAGTTWETVFDDQASYSLGCVAIDPGKPEVIWLGTGENVGGRHVGYGDGVYRSLDAGKSWENMGLKESEHIGKILVDPRNSNVVYVASQGPLWSGGGDRGLFKTSDGGATWGRILGGGEYTGVNDVIMDPRDPDVLYATTHQRLRTVAALINGGPETGIHKSSDGGKTWAELTSGLPEVDMGRIGLALAPQNPDVVYATIELPQRTGGFYRSTDAGGSWEKRSDYISGGTGPHYYQEIFASPHKFDRVYHMDVRAHVSEDGGTTFVRVGEKHKHGDNHALAFDPNDPDYLLMGSDGGLYESWDLGKNWKFVANLPVTQFYKVAVDYDEPFYNVYGGTQDNNTQGGPSRTDSRNGIRNADWFVTLFGDGHQPAVDPTNPNIVYSQWQQGNLVRHDRKTGEVIYIQPQPAEGEDGDRFNWDAPILISPHDPKTLFHASQRVWRSDDRGDSWRPISEDLTRGLDRMTLPMMGRVWSFDSLWDVYAMSKFGTVANLSQSPLDPELIYVGTDDGLVQVTEDGGETWRRIDELPGVPDFFFVNDIKADLHDADTVYVAVDDHKSGDFAPYLLQSADRGKTWSSIASDLPERHIVWRLVQDHEKAGLLFVGTEFGVFFSVDGGGAWVKLGGGAPNIPFRDLAIQRRENDLVGATFGRGFYILDDYTPLRSVSEEALEGKTLLFPVREADWYVERRTLGGSEKATQGGGYFSAPNPPFGAVFTYYLAEPLRTRKEQRREEEKKIEEEGDDTPYPGWDALREERNEEQPAIVLTVRNATGDVVRRLTGPVGKGMHRVAWDLRRPSTASWREGEDDDANPGFLAAPGRYSVELAQRVDGELTELGLREEFDVVPLRSGTLEGASPAEVAQFLERLGDLQRAVRGATAALGETGKRLDAIAEALMDSSSSGSALDDEARALRAEVRELQHRLSGDRVRARHGDPGPVSIARRLDVAVTGNRLSTYGPTATHLESVAIAEWQFAEVRTALGRLVYERLPAFEKKLDAAGVPWTPGRGVPGSAAGR